MAEERKEDALQEAEEGLSVNGSHQFMTFKSGTECYGIELKYVNEIMGIQPITEIPEVEDYIKGLINLRGKIVPVIDVRTRFKQKALDYNDRTCIIIVDVKSTVIGLIVETIADVVTIKDDDIEPPPAMGSGKVRNKYVYGLGKTGDGVKLLLNPEKLIKDEDLQAIDEVIEEDAG
ncbi:MAG: chemotaxis protein CheW [Lachnospiraceae bacterium]|nr:chemotaxis protein CheW [Lachnospiraceae bacterium]